MKSATKKIITVIAVVAIVAAIAVGFTACNNDPQTTNILFGKELLTLTKQIDTLTQLNAGGADIAVMDSIMAGYYTSTGSYKDKMVMLDNVMLSEEDYGIASKKGAEALMSKVNEALIALYKNGKMVEIANQFGLASEIKITNETVNPFENATDNSWNEIASEGKIIVGYTEFAPIAYKDDNGTLTGYDIELMDAVLDYLNDKYGTSVVLEIIIIDWNTKESQLANGSIDLVWNGMTITPALQQNCTISVPYLANKQACVVLKSDIEKYNTLAKFMKNAKDAIVAVENGSAAHKILTMEII